MLFTKSAILLPISTLLFGLANAVPQSSSSCSEAVRIAGAQQAIKVIQTHSATDAAAIPLAETCTRIIYLTPSELKGAVTLPVNVGVDATTIRAELVALATLLLAGVKGYPGGQTYTVNANGSVTADLVQTDFPLLPNTSLRQVHNYDLTTCEMTSIVGYAHGPLLPAA